MASCPHLNEIIDLGESSHVCHDCGLVLDKHYEMGSDYKTPLKDFQHDDWAETVKDILDRLHISTRYWTFIIDDFYKNIKKKTMERLIFSTYKILNSLDVNVSLHDLSLATGVNMSKIYLTQKQNETVKLDMSSLAEKFCCALNLDFKTTALIKERLSKPIETGHTPATVIAGSIYKIAKEQKLKISIKKISDITSVSPISIQRYKNAFP
jgi:transcription initiation factor TFIIIB Brf1 subunit/transcription initiation factor TFIIB